MEPRLQRVERMKQTVSNAARDACGRQLCHEVARHLRTSQPRHADAQKPTAQSLAKRSDEISIIRAVLCPDDSSLSLHQSNETHREKRARKTCISIDCDFARHKINFGREPGRHAQGFVL